MFKANRKPRLPNPVIYPYWRPFVLVGKPFFAMVPGLKGFFEINGLLPVFRPGIDDIMQHWWSRPFKFIIVPWRRLVSLNGEEMIERAVRAAKLGIPVEIYPEGTRDRTGEGGMGRLGAIQIAMEARVPLIPAGIYYGGHKGLLRRRQVAMVIGEAMPLPSCSFGELSKGEKIALADAW